MAEEKKMVVLTDGTVGEVIALKPQFAELHGLLVTVKTRDVNGNTILVEGVVREEL